MTPRDLQTLRNMGNEAEEAADEIDRLRAELERLRAQEPCAWEVYVPDAQNGYLVDSLDDAQLVDDMTNTNNVEVTPLYLAAPPAQPANSIEMSPEFTDTARSALLWVLWHHQGGSSKVGQPIRFALGMGEHEHLSDHQVREAKRWGALPQTVEAQPAQRLTDEPQWQPIETAPKDGTQYLACDGKKMWTRNQPPNCYAGDWEWNQNRTQWRGHADGLNPTHWMPLPAAPKG